MNTLNNVWLKFDSNMDEEPSYEANIVEELEDGMVIFVVEWYHTAVGQVSRREFKNLASAEHWLRERNFQDFSS